MLPARGVDSIRAPLASRNVCPVRLVPDIPCGKKEPRLFYRGFKCVSLEKVFYPKAQITQMAVQKMQVVVQKTQVNQSISSLFFAQLMSGTGQPAVHRTGRSALDPGRPLCVIERPLVRRSPSQSQAGVIRHFQERMPTGCSCPTFREESLARPMCF
jgi:hypothetical protein